MSTMIYALRAVSRLRNPTHDQCIASLLQKRFVKLHPIPAVSTVVDENFEQKNERLHRPMSPHITIYKFPLPAVMSISHRATGLALIGYVYAFGLACRLCPVPELINAINSLELGSATWTACKAVVVFPFCYHTFNGFRHLVWDFGLGLAMKSVYQTGYIVLALSALGSLLVAAFLK